MIDQNLMNYEYWSFHPMRSDFTIELKRDDFLNKFVKEYAKKIFVEVQLDDSKVTNSVDPKK